MWLSDLAAHYNKKTTEVSESLLKLFAIVKQPSPRRSKIAAEMWQPVSDQSNVYVGELLDEYADAPSNTVSSNLTCYTKYNAVVKQVDTNAIRLLVQIVVENILRSVGMITM